jgi:hypothetical protein
MSPHTHPRTRRTAAKVVYFHLDELARITMRARAACQSASQFIRESALGKSTAPDPLLQELVRIGERLDKLARGPGEVDGPLGDEIRAALDRHWGIVRELLERRRGKDASAR